MRLAQDKFYKSNVTKVFTIFKGTDREKVSSVRYTRYTEEIEKHFGI